MIVKPSPARRTKMIRDWLRNWLGIDDNSIEIRRMKDNQIRMLKNHEQSLRLMCDYMIYRGMGDEDLFWKLFKDNKNDNSG